MRIPWDSVLVSATAVALERRFGGARVRALLLEPEARRLVVWLRDATWVWTLHPLESGFAILPPADPPPEARPLAAKVRRVRAPTDDRVFVVELSRVRGTPSRVELVIELLPNRENVLMLEGEERTIRMLLRTREGDRDLVRGRAWVPPERTPRLGAEAPIPLEVWREFLAGDDDARRGALLREVAWTSPLLVDAILELDDADAGLALWTAARAAALGDLEDGTPAAVIRGRYGPMPWPLALPGRTLETVPDLLTAFERVAGDGPDGTSLLPRELVDRLRRHADRLRGRLVSLEQEFAGLEDPAEVRAVGDLILARFGDIPQGADEVVLVDFDGRARTVALDPTLRPDENARAFYDGAARIERAAERLPGLVDEARAAWRAADALLERAEAGDAERGEIEELLPAVETRGAGRADDAPSLPYRVYRASSGREIRVGRGAAKNDDLTFRHSAPTDIWLHARHTAGAHVILRWGRDDHPEPADLREAGILAALHSKARTSGSVPVDWTWRKYVRKPRKAPPGSVLPDRVKTVFVEPDPRVEERLRSE